MAPQVDAANDRDRRGQTRDRQAADSSGLDRPLTPLQQRIASSAVLLPVALFALWSGGALWALLIGVFALVMAWEWSAICAERRPVQVPWPAGRPTIAGLAMIATVALSLLLYATALLPQIPFWLWPVAGAGVTFLLAWPGHRWSGLWLVAGILYIVAGAEAAIALRMQPEGLATEIWIMALVVAVDTGAYAAGRTIGGPKLLPRISPSKTWAGLAGAILSAGVIGALAAALLDRPTVWPLAVASGLLAVVGQAGDLFESFLKRHFGVKDSGRIIPGHGGVLDRMDGLLAVVLAVAILERIFGGGILEWL
ncbi:MAG: phosphatidate cytidylyltransferase [Dongiaceae bacterium]